MDGTPPSALSEEQESSQPTPRIDIPVGIDVCQRPFPLLQLPPEIRDEIYKHLVIFDTNPPEAESYRSALCDRPSLDLSILRVNKRIHDEASRILYSKNIFPIRFEIRGTGTYQGNGVFRDSFRAEYSTFWETLTYQRPRSYNSTGTNFYNGDLPHDGMQLTKVTEDRMPTFLFPAHRYRNLVRRLRMFVHVGRFSFVELSPGLLDEAFRRPLRSILMPFMQRLHSVLGERNNHAHLEILLCPRSSWSRNSRPSVMSPEFWYELVCCAWPLTRGPWKYTLRMARDFFDSFEAVKKDALEQCDQDPPFTKKELASFETVKLREDAFWAITNGKLVVVDGDPWYTPDSIFWGGAPFGSSENLALLPS
ncbi:hypothetical protein Dda_3416 [Drechslerella dactyloides]|uniref:Uncharacterized protein n=1 Tax=Drechslerella dactyloides TaxID=74499 RepID=A0AAD6J3L7_DREDA|nr:hypothetical protein Dda_3416 [Drechslerella dactyloides]